MMQYKAVITKITSANLCMPIEDIINYFTKKCGKEGNISRTKRAIQMKQKTLFIVFEGLSFGEKIKI